MDVEGEGEGEGEVEKRWMWRGEEGEGEGEKRWEGEGEGKEGRKGRKLEKGAILLRRPLMFLSCSEPAVVLDSLGVEAVSLL